MTHRPTLALLVLLALAFGSACTSGPRWRATRNPDALDAAALLAADSSGLQRDLRPDEVPIIPIRERLRPCCAFGTQLQVRVGALTIPAFVIGNIRSPDAIGHHNYDAGRRGSDVAEGDEKNGLVYTCRAGFIDTAHVRDYADWTLFLASRIGRTLEDGSVIELPDEEGGRRRFVLEPVDPELLRVLGRKSISSSLAVWAAFQLSVWHEIATWYGWSSFGAFPERASAFSPEDLYSNLLGAKLVMPIVASGRDSSEDLFDRSIDVWLAQVLAFLGAVDAELGRAAMQAVDQLWWDSNARLPDDHLVLRRNLQLETRLQPWQVPEQPETAGLHAQLRQDCGGDLEPHVLLNPSRIPGLVFRDLVRLEVELNDTFTAKPALADFGGTIDQDDFPKIMDRIRQEVRAEFGPDADHPAPARGP